MLSYETVRTTQLAALTTAAEEWTTLRGRYLGLHDRLSAELAGPSAEGWEGEAAAAARALIAEVAGQFTAAGQESADLGTLLADAARQFADAQRQLTRLADEDAPAAHLRVSATGAVTDVHPLHDDESARHQPDYQAVFLLERRRALAELTGRIESVLRVATEADEAAAWALRSAPPAPGDRPFGPDGCHTLAEARQARADLGVALALAAKRAALTPDELTRLDALLSAHADDPAFAAEFATTLGPQPALELWRDLNDPTLSRSSGRQRTDALRRLQASLGAVLATATHSTDPAMRAWEQEIVRLGPRQLTRPGGGPMPTGYQLMSALLRSGRYAPGFLTAYGESLLAVERAAKVPPQLLWAPDATQPAWDHLGEGRGGDPVAGFLAALGHHPQAATAFLDPGDPRRTDHLVYLLHGRRWPEELVAGAHVRGLHTLGLAIEAATTGGHPDGLRHHTPAQARVLHDTVTLLDGGIGREHLPPGLHLPVAAALADYAADTHAVLSGTSRAAREHAAATAAGVWTDDRTGEVRMAVEKGPLIRVLRGLADLPEAHHRLQQAELTHIAERLGGLPASAPDPEWKGLMADSAVALGVLDAVQADAVLDQRDDAAKVAAWKAKGLYTGLGAPLKLVPGPGLGELTQRVLAAGIAEWQSGAVDAIDAAAAGRIERNTLTGTDGRSGHEGVTAMVEQWRREHGRQDPDGLAADWDKQQLRTVYNTGRTDAATALGRTGG
ncbi:hypothetical protein KV557_40400 [Kitasatospora aureofaciens]|uniref:hypothetical protein n=1 Tax=Kitasatospora aureofaciens TaxID=1894 RepID=UPI001C46D02F|nr:hypothetical protein [Kitasatospora aureofaciens]MBV6703277.1 hypothetical protein [Kitasatospora aureofaciens]